MAVIKCKMCGGDLNIIAGESVCECEYCGSRQTVPVMNDEKKLTLFARANRLRFNSEFDKASGIYESIIADAPQEAEAYWGLVLCKYGIEYVDDPGSGEKIPTCHRSSFDSVMQDADFDQACENADPIARKVYREEAKRIESIRKGILEVSSKEEPYDIFICYKETDAEGNRTLDSVLAQDLYDTLSDRGYRVFFARITLEDKLGQEFEPYIFAALNSAKIMLAVGTDYDYYNAVWVKNEWSRYLKLMAKDKEKHLIPCYKNLDAYDMPQEFAKLQAQDLGKVGAIQDLLRGIEKMLPREQKIVHETLIMNNQEIEPLLKRVELYLEDSDWKSADEYCERVLDMNPENGDAYFYKLLAELHCKTADTLKEITTPLDTCANYQKVLRFCPADRKIQLEHLNTEIHDKNELDRLEQLYNQAVSSMNSASTANGYKAAAKKFEDIAEYKDADNLKSKCLQKEKKARNKAKKISLISIIFVLTVTVLVFTVSNIGGYHYAKAGNYEMAQKFIFSPQITQLFSKNLAAYIDASRHMTVGNYRTAHEKYSAISGYLTAEELANEANYRYAEKILGQNLFDQAKERYTVLAEKEYKNASDMLKETEYLRAKYLLTTNDTINIANAVKIFEDLEKSGYKDSGIQCVQAQYSRCLLLIEQKEFVLAYGLLNDIKDSIDVKDTIKDLTEKLYKDGVDKYRKGEFYNAKLRFECTQSFRDTDKYLTLINIRNGYHRIYGKEYIETLFELKDFEDALDILLVDDLFDVYLTGTWRGRNDGKYFILKEDGHINYNIPWIDYGDYYTIEGGIFKLYPENNPNAKRNLFQFKIIEKDCVSVYCYKDGSRYTLYRQ